MLLAEATARASGLGMYTQGFRTFSDALRSSVVGGADLVLLVHVLLYLAVDEARKGSSRIAKQAAGRCASLAAAIGDYCL